MLPIVAIVGRPNVGKSTLFNQLTGTKAALVADFEGLTRDRIYGHIQSEKNEIIVIDTGGLDFDHGELSQTIQEQTETAIEEADLICFLVDGREGLANSDREVALDLRKKDKDTILVINKVEGMSTEDLEADFYSLGFKTMMSISAKRGDHCEDLIDLIEQKIDQPIDDSSARELDENEMSIALVGRPNVGKSTFINSFIKEDRLLTQNRPGTTRDSIFIDFKYKDRPLVLIDTAGRLHNKVNLMNELSKIKRVMQKVVDNAPQEVLLVLDGSTGQNAFQQAKEFTKATEVTSLAITKLDGTAKGGVVIGISDEFNIPVNYIGVGEGVDDLQVFNKFEFVDSFFK